MDEKIYKRGISQFLINYFEQYIRSIFYLILINKKTL